MRSDMLHSVVMPCCTQCYSATTQHGAMRSDTLHSVAVPCCTQCYSATTQHGAMRSDTLHSVAMPCCTQCYSATTQHGAEKPDKHRQLPGIYPSEAMTGWGKAKKNLWYFLVGQAGRRNVPSHHWVPIHSGPWACVCWTLPGPPVSGFHRGEADFMETRKSVLCLEEDVIEWRNHWYLRVQMQNKSWSVCSLCSQERNLRQCSVLSSSVRLSALQWKDLFRIPCSFLFRCLACSLIFVFVRFCMSVWLCGGALSGISHARLWEQVFFSV